MKNEQNILVAFLDWGLGHATRCMPIVEALLDKGKTVVLAGNGKSLQLMQQQFPDLKSYELPDYNIQYNGSKNAAWQILFQARKIFKAIESEHKILEQIVKNEAIKTIISDNRYGIYNKHCKNIFLTHQIAIQAPKPYQFVEPFLLNRIQKLISKFDELWIPDIENDNENLTGKLAHQIQFKLPTNYIGILSRFQNIKNQPNIKSNNYKIVAVISGVEPSRTQFEEQLLAELKQLNEACLLVAGKVESEQKTTQHNLVTRINFLQSEELRNYLQQAEIIICRSGYSTIMDLVALEKKVILIPTPGQTEQEYLAERLTKQNVAVAQKQSSLNLQVALTQIKTISGFKNNAQYQFNTSILDSI